MRALIADDDPDLLSLAKSILWQVHGIEAEPVRDAELALASLSRNRPDVLILDHALPDMSALEVLELLKLSGDDIPLILLVPKEGGSVAAEALEEGASFCLRKCGDPTLLMTELGNMAKVAVQMRQAKEALLKGDESFWEMISKSPDMIFIVDANATLHYLNPAGAGLMCANAKELLGSSVVKAFHSEDVPRITESISRCVSSPGRPFRQRLLGRSRNRSHLCLEGEALSADGRTVIFYLADVSSQVVSDLLHPPDNVLWRDLTLESRERRQRDLAREMTFRLISRILVDRMSDSEAAVAQNRFRSLGGLAMTRPGVEPASSGIELTGPQEDGDVMGQLIDRLAMRIDLQEIDGDARRVEEANRRFYGPE